MEVFYEYRRDMEERQFRLGTFGNMNFPPHLHNSFELLFLQEGSMSVTVNENKEELRAGDVAVVLPGDIHSYETQDVSRGFMMFFTENYCGDLQQIFGKYSIANHVSHMPSSGIDAINEKYERIGDHPYAHLFFKGYVSALFYEIIGSITLVNKKKDVGHDLLKRALIHIRQGYDSGINLNETAEVLGMSRSYVSRFFRKTIGCGFNEYVNRLRVEKSKTLLTAGSLGVLDIAIECGFDNQRSFDRTFKKYAKMTPSEYRKNS